jgi:hypothetical protein
VDERLGRVVAERRSKHIEPIVRGQRQVIRETWVEQRLPR